jgi:hypothetical protein
VGDLTVHIYGPSKVETEGYFTFSATASGGTAPYYYIWTEEVCWTDGTCQAYGIDEGWGLSSISHLVRSDMTTDDVEVQIGDASMTVTGIAGRPVLAPGAKYVGGGNPSMCDRLPSYYPFTWDKLPGDPNNGKHFLRSSCDGSPMWQPTQ